MPAGRSGAAGGELAQERGNSGRGLASVKAVIAMGIPRHPHQLRVHAGFLQGFLHDLALLDGDKRVGVSVE